MRKRVLVFLSVVLATLFVLPVVNIVSAPAGTPVDKLLSRSFLFNMDFIEGLVARGLYPFGISIDPKQVVIGRDGWLYLGDHHGRTKTIARRPPTVEELQLNRRIAVATAAWEVHLAAKGVKLFRVLIGPDKETIYPEYLPKWVAGIQPGPTDALLAATGTRRYIDPRGPLLAAKSRYSIPLYYKADTHWNYLGASVAFRHFAEQVAPDTPELRWPDQSYYELEGAGSRPGGDLARFLRMVPSFSDEEPYIQAQKVKPESVLYDFDTREVLVQGNEVGSPQKPVLLHTPGALNDKRVLWLRDSFGVGLAPLMSATFTELVQLHWFEALQPGGRFMQLVDEWKPDYVFITVVERASRAEFFSLYPPPIILAEDETFRPLQTPVVLGMHHLAKGQEEGEYRIAGSDPLFNLSVPDPVAPTEVGFLRVGLSCADGSSSVPFQIYWLQGDEVNYHWERSVNFTLPAGRNLIDLRTLPGVDAGVPIHHLRLDFRPEKACETFSWEQVELGVRTSPELAARPAG